VEWAPGWQPLGAGTAEEAAASRSSRLRARTQTAESRAFSLSGQLEGNRVVDGSQAALFEQIYYHASRVPTGLCAERLHLLDMSHAKKTDAPAPIRSKDRLSQGEMPYFAPVQRDDLVSE
jgi:hypothetical protein